MQQRSSHLILKLLVTDFLEYPMMRGGGNRPLVVGTTSARPSGLYSIPGGLSLFRPEHAFAPASRRPRIWPSTPPPGNAGTTRRGAAPSRRPRQNLQRNSRSHHV